jgi:cyclase
MEIPRVIPVLLLNNAGLYKTLKFKEPKYVGDPVNAVKIFNDKEVDELIFLDVSVTKERKKIDYKLLEEIAGECFMPLCYGGGITSVEQIRNIISIGVEKVSLNTVAVENPQFVREASDSFGSSTIVVSIDVKKNFWGKAEVCIRGGSVNTGLSVESVAVEMNKMGAGEILLNSIDRDGTMKGYDLDLIQSVTSEVDVPVIACGGAGIPAHFSDAVEKGASAVAAGSMFVFHGKHRAVLISYPSQPELKSIFSLK